MWYQSRRSSDCVVDEAASAWEECRLQCFKSVQELFAEMRAEIRELRLENEAMYRDFKSDLLVMKEKAKLVNKRSDLVPSQVLEKVDLEPFHEEEKTDLAKDGQLQELQLEDVKPAQLQLEDVQPVLGEECASRQRRQRKRKWQRWKQHPPVLAAVRACFIGGRRFGIPCTNCCSRKVGSRIPRHPTSNSGNFRSHLPMISGSCYGCHSNYDWAVDLMSSGGILLENNLIFNGFSVYSTWDPGGIYVLIDSMKYVVRKCFKYHDALSFDVEFWIKAVVGYLGGFLDVESIVEFVLNQLAGKRKCKSEAALSLIFSLRVMEAATDTVSELNLLVKGGFGLVYKRISEDGQEIAVKKPLDSRKESEMFLNGVGLLFKMQHKNLISFGMLIIKIVSGMKALLSRVHEAFAQLSEVQRWLLNVFGVLGWVSLTVKPEMNVKKKVVWKKVQFELKGAEKFADIKEWFHSKLW